MILLVLVVLLWVAVLAPSAWRRFSERQGVGSIDHFHHQLQLLEHAGPKTVAPAYRLHTALPGAGPTDSVVDPPSIRRGRNWCCCDRPTTRRRQTSMAMTDPTMNGLACWTGPNPSACQKWGRELPSLRREQARRRCTTLLRCLGGVAVSTGLIGVFPGMHLVWIVTGLSGLAALGLVGSDGLRQRARGRAARRRRHRSAARAEAQEVHGPARAGYPGAWDEDDFEVPQAAAR